MEEVTVKKQLDMELIGQGMPESTHGERESLFIGNEPSEQVFSLNHEYVTEGYIMPEEVNDDVKYNTVIKNEFVCYGAKDFDEYISALESHIVMLREWRELGVLIDHDMSDINADFTVFYTHDAVLAQKLDFTEEWDENEDYYEDFNEEDEESVSLSEVTKDFSDRV